MTATRPAAPGQPGLSPAAVAVMRGTGRLLFSLGFSTVTELPLGSGRRADMVGIDSRGEVWIVEVKSCLADLRADTKWPDYRRHCDRLFFASSAAMPPDAFPGDTGLIAADSYGAAILRPAPEHRLAPATRRAVTLRFARLAATRLQMMRDPEARVSGEAM